MSRTRNLLVTSPILYQLDHYTHSSRLALPHSRASGPLAVWTHFCELLMLPKLTFRNRPASGTFNGIADWQRTEIGRLHSMPLLSSCLSGNCFQRSNLVPLYWRWWDCNSSVEKNRELTGQLSLSSSSISIASLRNPIPMLIRWLTPIGPFDLHYKARMSLIMAANCTPAGFSRFVMDIYHFSRNRVIIRLQVISKTYIRHLYYNDRMDQRREVLHELIIFIHHKNGR